MAIGLRLLVPLWNYVRAFAVLALAAILPMLVRPMLKSLAHPRGGIVTRIAASPIRTLARGLLWIERQTSAALAGFAAGSLAVIAGWLIDASWLARETYKEFNAQARDTLEAFGILRTETLPRVAKSAAAPALARAKGAERLGRTSISLGKTMRVRFGRSISLITKRLGALALVVAGIDVLVKGRNAARHHRDHARDIPQIRDRDIPRAKAKDRAHDQTLARHGTRLGRLEKALGLGVLTGVVLRVLAKRFPWLWCRNLPKVANALCSLNPLKLNLLLGLLTGTLLIRDIRTVASYAESVTEQVGRGIVGLLSAGDLPGGRFTID
jgi:hypothetical protein